MKTNEERLVKLIEELYSGWSETNDGKRQRDGHPPKEETDIAISNFLDDLRTGDITLQASEQSFFVHGVKRRKR